MKTFLGFCDLGLTFTVAVEQNRSNLSDYGEKSDSSDNDTRFRKTRSLIMLDILCTIQHPR